LEPLCGLFVTERRCLGQGKNAITKAGWTFAKGEQLFENYGQPNHIYFEYHGFSLAENTHDCAQVDGFELPAGSDVQVRSFVLCGVGHATCLTVLLAGCNALCVAFACSVLVAVPAETG